MVALVHEYAQDVVDGKIIAGPPVRAACARHLRDLDRLSDRYYFDQEAANRVCSFFPDLLCHYEGQFADQPFELFQWQQFIAGSLYGWKRYDNGLRRFRRAYIETAKGSGKSPFIAGLGVYAITSDGEMGAEGYLAARKAEQALVTFRPAAEMVRRSPELSAVCDVSGGNYPHNISYLKKLSFLRRTAGKGLSGPKPHIVIIDEFHEHETSETIDLLSIGVKFRQQPLVIIITNSGSDPLSPCGVEHNFAVKVAEGDLEAESYFSYVCALDEEDEPFHDESCWIKTNPSLPAVPGYDFIRDEIEQARGMPSKRSEKERLLFCIWTEAEDGFIERDIWISCERRDGLGRDLSKPPCFGGLDIGIKKDLCAGALVWDFGMNGNGSNHYGARLKIWTPEDTLRQKEESDGVPYTQWVEQGYITAVPGKVLRLEWVAQWIVEVMEHHNLVGIAYDPWKIDLLEDALDEYGVETTRNPKHRRDKLLLASHPQGFIAGARKVAEQKKRRKVEEVALHMPRSVDSIEDSILLGSIGVEFNPALRRAALGAVIRKDPASNRAYAKNKATARIDPIVALTMAKGFADVELPKIAKMTLSDYTMGQIKDDG